MARRVIWKCLLNVKSLFMENDKNTLPSNLASSSAEITEVPPLEGVTGGGKDPLILSVTRELQGLKGDLNALLILVESNGILSSHSDEQIRQAAEVLKGFCVSLSERIRQLNRSMGVQEDGEMDDIETKFRLVLKASE